MNQAGSVSIGLQKDGLSQMVLGSGRTAAPHGGPGAALAMCRGPGSVRLSHTCCTRRMRSELSAFSYPLRDPIVWEIITFFIVQMKKQGWRVKQARRWQSIKT